MRKNQKEIKAGRKSNKKNRSNRVYPFLIVVLVLSFCYVSVDSSRTRQKLKNLNKIVDSQDELLKSTTNALLYLKQEIDRLNSNQKKIAKTVDNMRVNRFL